MKFLFNQIKYFIGFGIILLISIQCEKPIERRAIDTGSPLTILAPNSEIKPETIEWYYAIRPHKSQSKLNSSFESARFSPDYPGHYDIVAELYNLNDEILSYKVFKYNAIGPVLKSEENIHIKLNPDTINPLIETDSLVDNSGTLEINTDTLLSTINSEYNDSFLAIIDTFKKQKIEIKEEPQYTIQVFSLPDENQANAKLKLLKNAGFDAYMLAFIHPKYNENWYRVRVGKFIEFSSADSIAEQINTKFNLSTWIDRLNK